ncbi:hypothetical protein D3C76_558550 [compost metagenome]
MGDAKTRLVCFADVLEGEGFELLFIHQGQFPGALVGDFESVAGVYAQYVVAQVIPAQFECPADTEAAVGGVQWAEAQLQGQVGALSEVGIEWRDFEGEAVEPGAYVDAAAGVTGKVQGIGLQGHGCSPWASAAARASADGT